MPHHEREANMARSNVRKSLATQKAARMADVYAGRPTGRPYEGGTGTARSRGHHHPGYLQGERLPVG